MFGRGSLERLLLVCYTVYYLIFHIMPATVFLNSKEYHCIAQCNSDTCRHVVKTLRDDEYFIAPELNGITDTTNCKVTAWELTHYLFHVYIGYEFGLVSSTIISVGFEIIEHYKYNCGSILDVGYNLAGALTGIGISKLI